MYYDWLEALIHRGLWRAGYAGVVSPKMRGVSIGLGVAVRRRPPPGMLGWSDSDIRAIQIDPVRDECGQEEHLAHELVHLLAADGGMPDPQDEEVVEVGGYHLRMPLWGIRRLIRHEGLTPALARHYPLMLPSEVLLWGAHVTDHVVFLHIRGRRQVSACRYLELKMVLPTERALVRAVSRERRPVADPLHEGVCAYPFFERQREGVVVVVDLRALERSYYWGIGA